MIEQSEIRQQRELALRLSQVAREVDTQQKADLLRIQQNLGQFEMQTGAQIDQQQQMMDYLVSTSGGAEVKRSIVHAVVRPVAAVAGRAAGGRAGSAAAGAARRRRFRRGMRFPRSKACWKTPCATARRCSISV